MAGKGKEPISAEKQRAALGLNKDKDKDKEGSVAANGTTTTTTTTATGRSSNGSSRSSNGSSRSSNGSSSSSFSSATKTVTIFSCTTSGGLDTQMSYFSANGTDWTGPDVSIYVDRLGQIYYLEYVRSGLHVSKPCFCRAGWVSMAQLFHTCFFSGWDSYGTALARLFAGRGGSVRRSSLRACLICTMQLLHYEAADNG